MIGYSQYMRRSFILALLLVGCSAPHDHDHPPTSTTPQSGHHHHHPAPHGGQLIEIGEEFAHLEALWKPESGELRIYVLDGEAQRGVPLVQPSIRLQVGQQSYELPAQSNALSGEKPGNSSEFAAQLSELKNRKAWTGEVEMIEVKGQKFPRLKLEISP